MCFSEVLVVLTHTVWRSIFDTREEYPFKGNNCIVLYLEVASSEGSTVVHLLL